MCDRDRPIGHRCFSGSHFQSFAGADRTPYYSRRVLCCTDSSCRQQTQHERCSLIHDQMTHMILFFLTNRFLGSHLQSDGGINDEVCGRVKAAWMRWKEVNGVVCDK